MGERYPAPVETLHADPYFTVTLDPARRLVRVKRSATPFPDVPTAERTFERMGRLIDERRLADHALLVDSRDAIGRNDADFENMTGRFRARLFGSFARTAMLVRTVVGRMQADRMRREQGGPAVEVFFDEAEAERYLASGR